MQRVFAARWGAWLIALLVANASSAAHSVEKKPLTVDDALNTARLMRSPEATSPANPQGAVSVSPSGNRYVLRVLRGDVAMDGTWLELFTGQLTSMEAAASPVLVTRLFTSGKGRGGFEFLGPDLDASEFFNPLRWLDDDRIVFFWSDARGTRQAILVDLIRRRVTWLTDHDSPVGAFDVSKHGVMLYNADATKPRIDNTNDRSGFVVAEGTDVYSILRGDLQAGSVLDVRMNTEWFIRTEPEQRPQHLSIAGRSFDRHMLHEVRLSPDGNLAVLNSAPLAFPAEWDRVKQRDMRVWIADARRDPTGMMARGVQQLFIVDLRTSGSRPLWNAPSITTVTRAEWSPDGKKLLVAPTYLPPETTDERGLSGRAAAVVDVVSGQYEQLPVALQPMQNVAYMHWLTSKRILIADSGPGGPKEYSFRRVGQRWRAEIARPVRTKVRVELRENLENPPRLFAVDTATGRERLVIDPNPGLCERFTLGKVERKNGVLSTGDEWHALLFYPVNYHPDRRFPLVIQSVYGSIDSSFTLYGGGTLGPAEMAPYAAQMLANKDIFVLHLSVDVGEKFNTPGEAKKRMQAFEELSKELADSGLIDRARVGLLGFSRNGYYVQYTLTHSNEPFAAAIAADNFDASYMPITIMGDVVNGTSIIGAAPFGSGLSTWIEEAPGFNVHRVNVPLRMVQQSFGAFGVLLNWEIFSRLRYLNKPVELFVMPDHKHGAHSMQNPGQIQAVQEGTVEWFDFWLNGREAVGADKEDQNGRWRKLKHLLEMSTQ